MTENIVMISCDCIEHTVSSSNFLEAPDLLLDHQ